ncbi:MAG: serine hydrolase [Luteitalea sp.]|nr:serine hydrolase [Luteitalea sp.]
MTAGRLLAAAIAMIAATASQAVVTAETRAEPFAGRPLHDALQALRREGLKIIFSTELVRSDMLVSDEPRATSPRKILDELLRPHGLRAKDGPRETVLVVKAPPRRPASRSPPPKSHGSVSGHVVDARTGAPLPGVLVQAPVRTGIRVYTDARGAFRIDDLPAGHQNLVVGADGFMEARPTATVPAAGVVDPCVVDEVRKHIPEWADDKNRLTIRHLLTHTSGLRDAFLLRELAAPSDQAGDLNEAIVSILARQRTLNFTPGSEFEYSNSGYVLLASLVKRVSAQSLRAFADANIFKPLGMRHTHVHDDPAIVVSNRAEGYHREAGRVDLIPHADLGHLIGTTGLFTTVRDLLRWQENFTDVRVGDRAFLTEMQRPTVLRSGETSQYGFGLEIGQDRGLRTIGHGGGDPGYAAYVIRYPDRGLAVAVLCNLDNIGPMVGGLARSVAGVYLTDIPAPSKGGETTTAAPVLRPADKLANKLGLYRDPAKGTFARIFIRDGKLVWASGAGEGESIDLTPVSATRFVIPQTPIAVEFPAAAPGRPQEVHVFEGRSKPVVMQRVPPFAPSSTELRPFLGRYASAELDVTYEMTARDSGLVIQRPGRDDIPLKPILSDTFSGRLVNVVTFLRDTHGQVSGFTVNAHGVRNLRFDRVKPLANTRHSASPPHRA